MTTNNRPIPSRIRVRPGPGGPPSVDGHPGWVADENASWGWTALLTVFAFGLVMGTGMVLSRARSAAWWVNTLGTLVGAMLTWLPVWGVMRAEDGALTYDEALARAFGAPLSMISGEYITYPPLRKVFCRFQMLHIL